MNISQQVFFGLFAGGPADPAGGRVSWIEMGAMAAVINALRLKRVAEFGVHLGKTAKRLLEICPAIESYLGVDVPPGTIPPLAYQTREVPLRAGEFALSDPRFQLSLLGSQAIDLPRLDCVFIDGDHSEAGVRADTRVARGAVRPGGVIFWHDYDNAPAIGPKIVIDELNAAEGDHILRLEGTGLCFELRK